MPTACRRPPWRRLECDLEAGGRAGHPHVPPAAPGCHFDEVVPGRAPNRAPPSPAPLSDLGKRGGAPGPPAAACASRDVSPDVVSSARDAVYRASRQSPRSDA